MYPIPPTETFVETKTCRHCSASFPITDKDLEFYEKVSPVFPLNRHSEFVSESSAFPNNKEDPGSSPGWRNVKIEWDKIRYLIPTPTLCPDCRQQRRLSWRNERKLYKRKCDATNKDIISIYSPDKPFKVYHQDYWWSDKWDPMEYGREFDFGRGFFEQFGELMGEVPYRNLISIDNENSDYSNLTWHCKNCYLLSSWYGSEDCFYGGHIDYSKDCLDCEWVNNCSHCYDCDDSRNSFNCFYSQSLDSCSDCYHSNNLTGCKYCLFCTWLNNMEYHILNKPSSKEEYFKVLSSSSLYKQYLDEYKILNQKTPKRFVSIVWSERCTGENIKNSSDLDSCFNIVNSTHCKYCYESLDISDCMDCFAVWIDDGALNYECLLVVMSSSKILFSLQSFPQDSHLIYCFDCSDSSHLFACAGLRNKQYCILNKQYTREEYEALVPRIIEHMMKSPIGGRDAINRVSTEATEWWEFFPSTLSPFGYNETVAMEYYPLDKPHPQPFSTRGEGSLLFSFPSPLYGEGSGVRFNWSDYEAPFPKVEKIIPADKLPDDITKIPDDILNWAIECEVTGKPFRIIKQELEFYRKHNIPIPRRHPDQRHLDRMALRNPRKLFERKCDKCGVEMVTTYSPDRKEIVYCESCYNAEVIG